MPLYLKQLGAPSSYLGYALVIAVSSEMLFFVFSSTLMKRFGLRTLIIAAHVAYLLRFGGYCIISEPWQLLFFEVLHGATFASFWSCAIALGHSLAPSKAVAATSQSLWQGSYTGKWRDEDKACKSTDNSIIL
jgi:PPP family 3-phenylpropionic acid transporter